MAVFEFTRRMDADEALAAFRCESTLGKVELTAGAADLLVASRFSVDLAIEVEVDAAVDGDEFIDAGDDADVIDIAYRCVEYDLVVIDEIIEALRTAGKSVHDFAFVTILLARNLTGFIEVNVGVDEHFRMTAQVLNVRFSQFLADSRRNAADAELQGTAVFDEGNDVIGDLIIEFRARAIGDLRHLMVRTFDDIVDVAEVQFRFIAQCLRHVLVDFEDNHFSCANEAAKVRSLRPDVEVAPLIHGMTLDDQFIDMLPVFRQFVKQDRQEPATAVFAHLPFKTVHMARSEANLIVRVTV